MHSPKECCFDHERLEVYQESIAFIAWLSALLDGTVRIGEVKDQLDRASTSIPLNIAEGNGKYAARDSCGFLISPMARRVKFTAGLDILVAKAKLKPDQVRPRKESLQRIVRMLIGLIKRHSTREYHKGDAAN